jgi:hypothetical protein
MKILNIHENIKTKLKFFIKENKIPHIIFHGPSGSGKRYILNYFINEIYNGDKYKIKTYVLYVNCAHIKGIRFIRDELKFFAKINIQKNDNILFKSIILLNADKLTIDAQSALRRCIEQFSHSTRFFIVIENKDTLLNPILSRFCNIYITLPTIKKKIQNLHFYKTNGKIKKYNKMKNEKLKKLLNQKHTFNSIKKCNNFSNKLYQQGFSALDLIKNIEINEQIPCLIKYKILIYFDIIRKEFRNEKMLINLILYFVFMRKNVDLENIL